MPASRVDVLTATLLVEVLTLVLSTSLSLCRRLRCLGVVSPAGDGLDCCTTAVQNDRGHV